MDGQAIALLIALLLVVAALILTLLSSPRVIKDRGPTGATGVVGPTGATGSTGLAFNPTSNNASFTYTFDQPTSSNFVITSTIQDTGTLQNTNQGLTITNNTSSQQLFYVTTGGQVTTNLEIGPYSLTITPVVTPSSLTYLPYQITSTNYLTNSVELPLGWNFLLIASPGTAIVTFTLTSTNILGVTMDVTIFQIS